MKTILETFLRLVLFFFLLQYTICNNLPEIKQKIQIYSNCKKYDSLRSPDCRENKENDKNVPINNIIRSLTYTIDLLGKTESNELITESIENLYHALKTINKSSNIYSPSLKSITKNMDIEDKIFIEQNTYNIPAFAISDQTPTKPINININNEFIYGISELSGILKQIGKE